MSIVDIVYSLIIKPIELVFDIVFSFSFRNIGNVGVSLIILSIVVNVLVLPLYIRADELQAEEQKKRNKIKRWENHIKSHFKGDEKYMILQVYYKQNGYKPYYSLRSAISLLLEIPFFIAAYHYISQNPMLEGLSFGPISDLSKEDGLLVILGMTINVLPIVMTVINIISVVVYNRVNSFKEKMQLFIVAFAFLALLYNSPSGLVLYWTCNNLFSLIKNMIYRLIPRLNNKKESKCEKNNKNKKDRVIVLVSSTLLFSILVGSYIPYTLYQSSPFEFFDYSSFSNPIWYIVNSFCVSMGLFSLWVWVYYSLLNEKGKTFLSILSFIICIIAFLDFSLIPFESEMTRYLTLATQIETTPLIIIQSSVIIVSVFLLGYYFYKYKKHSVGLVLSFVLLSFFLLNMYSLIKLGNVYDKKIAKINAQNSVPEISFSKNGKNVVVIMMDRMVGYYIPFIMNEKPELLDSWDGFTYYPNTISFGSATNAGSPGLYGGYEYRPSELNKRDRELLKDKQNEALKVMPVIFSENNYKVAVGDPTYANYEWIPDLGIYDDYPDINAFYLEGRFNNYTNYTYDSIMNRNLVLYGVYRVTPVFLKKYIYNDGYYGSITNTYSNGVGVCTFASPSISYGIGENFLNAYSVLLNLPNISKISDDSSDCFNMFSNNTTHEANLLQMPDYSLSVFVNNTDYDGELNTKYSLDGSCIDLFDTSYDFNRNDTIDDGTISKVICYHSDMVSMMRLGEWFDYLRDNDVYDNTKIIIVSDHSCAMGLDENLFYKLTFQDGSEMSYDLLSMQSALLVKDFNDEGFDIDYSFMTNADVPIIATKDLIDSPTNPFTGKKLDDSAKYNEKMEIMSVDNWNTEDNGGYKFLPAQWFSVHDNIFDGRNWDYEGAY